MVATRRRKPQQERSRQTVERIVDAAARVLEREGDRAATTNRIAEEAGVSPGSLYQYFEDRDDLLIAVIQRFVAEFEERVVPVLRLAALGDVVTGTAATMAATLDALEDRADLLRALMAYVPGDRQEEVTRALRARVTDSVFASTASRRPDLSPAEVERVTWMLVELAQTLPLRYVLDRPPIARDVFLEDTVRLLATYTMGTAPAMQAVAGEAGSAAYDGGADHCGRFLAAMGATMRPTPTRSGTMPTITKLDFVAIPTQDAERARAFYGETLGLRADPHAQYEFWAGDTCLGIWCPEQQGMPFAPQKNGHLALHVEDVAATQAELEAQGVSFTRGAFDTGVCHMALFTDPDGNDLMLHSRHAPAA